MWSDEVLEKIKSLGSLNYPLSKCVNVLELRGAEKAQFESDFRKPDTEVAQFYQIGRDLADFEIDSKLFQLAKTGDLKSIKEYDERCRRYAKKM